MVLLSEDPGVILGGGGGCKVKLLGAKTETVNCRCGRFRLISVPFSLFRIERCKDGEGGDKYEICIRKKRRKGENK